MPDQTSVLSCRSTGSTLFYHPTSHRKHTKAHFPPVRVNKICVCSDTNRYLWSPVANLRNGEKQMVSDEHQRTEAKMQSVPSEPSVPSDTSLFTTIPCVESDDELRDVFIICWLNAASAFTLLYSFSRVILQRTAAADRSQHLAVSEDGCCDFYFLIFLLFKTFYLLFSDIFSIEIDKDLFNSLRNIVQHFLSYKLSSFFCCCLFFICYFLFPGSLATYNI